MTQFPESADELFHPPANSLAGRMSAGLERRSLVRAISFLPVPMLASVAWVAGGSPTINDIAMVYFTALCIVFLIEELVRFPSRLGIGGLVLYSGCLIWFAHDYLQTWFFANYSEFGVEPWVISKAVTLLGIFVVGASIGLGIKRFHVLDALARRLPDAPAGTLLFAAIALFLFGICAYVFFTAEPFWISIWKAMTGMRSGEGTVWTVGRTGNMNYSWGGYVAQIVDTGQFSGVLACFYAVFLARGLAGKVTGWFIWAFWTAIGFGSGARGALVFAAMPAVFFVFIRFQVQAAQLLRRFSWRAYVFAGILGVISLFLIQFQGSYRTTKTYARDWNDVDVTAVRGNSMFSEGLLAVATIPEKVPFFSARIPGEGALRVVPDTVIAAIIHPIPRALWTNKPVDSAWEWYNTAFTHGRNDATIAPGLHVGPFIRYGYDGLLVYSILFGYLLASCERILSAGFARPIQILASISLAAWLFRCFRGGFGMPEFYSVALGLAALAAVTVLSRPLFGRGSTL